MTTWHLAQLNVARAVAPLDSPTLAEFMGALDRINALAEASPGFVWRLQDEGGNATAVRTSDDPQFIVNLSVWSSVEALFAGHVPTVEEALDRLAHLRTQGPSPHAFTFKSRHPHPGETGEPIDMEPERYCR